MSWAVGYSNRWMRWIGYGVPAYCDHPGCDKEIDRGLAYKCGGPWAHDDYGCGLYFCGDHMYHAECEEDEDGEEGEFFQACECCRDRREPFSPKPEHPDWINHVLTDVSWATWRTLEPAEYAAFLRMKKEIK